jgi:hypothetical protein
MRLPLCAAVAVLGLACGPSGQSLEPTYDNVELFVGRTCAFSTSCHGGLRGQARLNFEMLLDEGMPITEALVDVPACEYDFYDRVEPGAPERSWLMIKLEHAHDPESGEVLFEPDPAWDLGGLMRRPDGTLPTSTCPLVEDGELTFGENMPNASASRPTPLRPEEIEMFRQWILMGAPGPTAL